MNNFFASYHTDVGIKKKTNQDSLLLQVISDGTDEFLLAVICDGMGGMAKGELASATGIRTFADWFSRLFLRQGVKENTQQIFEQWQKLLADMNRKLIQYGGNGNIQLGTTVTAVLLFPDGRYLAVHVGDTRIYQISDEIRQLTEDHTFVAREIKRGTMTPEQAAYDARRNVLLQCIGVNEYFEPQFLQGILNHDEELLLCSDGFRHQVTDEEIYQVLYPGKMKNEETMKRELVQMVELNKQRREPDNISVILIKRR